MSRLPRMRAWIFSSATSSGRPAKTSTQGVAVGVEDLGDGQNVEVDAQILRRVGARR